MVTTEKEKKMYRTANQTTSTRRRIGVLVFTGAAAGLVTFAAAAGSAAASPDAPFVPNLPSLNTDAVALNPQPLPPGPDFSRVALNPQPLPPGPDWLRVLLPRVGF
ncbi:MAG: hypothetical protein WAL26_16140 [Mycobacterium sp.]